MSIDKNGRHLVRLRDESKGEAKARRGEPKANGRHVDEPQAKELVVSLTLYPTEA